MEINPQRPLRPVAKPTAKKKAGEKAASAPVDSAEGSVFLGSDLQAAVEAGLEALPEVRQEKLDDGRRLAGDPGYPDAKEMDEVSRLAARQFLRDREAGEGADSERGSAE